MQTLDKLWRLVVATPLIVAAVLLMGAALAVALATACLCGAVLAVALILFTIGRSINTRKMPSLREWFEDAMR